MKEFYKDRWAKTKAEYIWKSEKNKENVLEKVQSKGSVEEIMLVVEENQAPKFFEADWNCIKKYIPKHIMEDLVR